MPVVVDVDVVNANATGRDMIVRARR